MTDSETGYEHEAYVSGTQVYVTSGDCVELAQQRNQDEGPQIVHICSDDWPGIVAAASDLLARKASHATEHEEVVRRDHG